MLPLFAAPQLLDEEVLMKDSPLGQKTAYVDTYSPELLYPIPRREGRKLLGIEIPSTMRGIDHWTAYEISYLNMKGKPEIIMGHFEFHCDSPSIVESKSLKLYLNSFSQTPFASLQDVEATISKDLSRAIDYPVQVTLFHPSDPRATAWETFQGICLDTLDITVDTYHIEPGFLRTHPSRRVKETVYSHLLKSNCPETGQPDWGSVLIRYSGDAIDHEGLLKYLISFRSESAIFAEYCVEQIFCHILARCTPEHLSVYARYMRRGGLDINPFRSNLEGNPENRRLVRQ